MNIDIMQAKDCFYELIEQTISGNEIIITRNNNPVVRLIPVMTQAKTHKKKRQFGSAKGLIKMSDDFDEPLEDFKDYI